ncbi:MAG TPA: hypothetical protein VG890_04185 [Puia sp.]|nr:hypothetical protein [Puia sp.]
MNSALSEFLDTLTAPQPPEEFSVFLKSLWYDKKGAWNEAHGLVDHLSGADAARVHAYLHRREGDLSNAGYWYRQARTTMPNLSLDEEWNALVIEFMNK